MSLFMQQQLKLHQTLKLTPQLQQAIRLLQLSHLELAEKVSQELEENPFLEVKEQQPEETRPQEDDRRTPEADDSVYEQEAAKNADWEEYIGDFSSAPKETGQQEVQEETLTLEQRLSERTTLAGHLLWQLHLASFSEEEIKIGECIIGNLESNGRLSASNAELAELAGTTADKVKDMVSRIQVFDPVGVACRTLQESLLVQVKSRGLDKDAVLVSIISDHLEDLENGQLKAVKKLFRLNDDDLREYVAVIRSLDPMPGSDMGGGEPQYVSPDATVFKVGDEFVILLNDDNVPSLSINDEMLEKCCAQEKEESGEEQARDRAYCAEKLRDAKNLVSSLEYRRRTLYRTLESIVRHQREFFEKGPKGLKPLVLNDVAQDINMHESTVSRITTSKYVATRFGTFELKYFFNSAVSAADGSDAVGSEGVREEIREMVASEDPQNPLSDEAIASMLNEKLGIQIARRTVAKYRTVLDIPSSSKRKKRF